jgi:uncharacterized membrane protein YgcG
MEAATMQNCFRNGLIATAAATVLVGASLVPGAGAARAANGFRHHHWRHHHHHLVLTDAQRQCLVDHGIALPTPGVRHDPDVTKPPTTVPTPTSLAAVHSAFVACGIVFPSRAPDPTPPTTTATATTAALAPAPAPGVQSFHGTPGSDPSHQGGPSFGNRDDHHFGGSDRFSHSGGGPSSGGGGWHGGGGGSSHGFGGGRGH